MPMGTTQGFQGIDPKMLATLLGGWNKPQPFVPGYVPNRAPGMGMGLGGAWNPATMFRPPTGGGTLPPGLLAQGALNAGVANPMVQAPFQRPAFASNYGTLNQNPRTQGSMPVDLQAFFRGLQTPRL